MSAATPRATRGTPHPLVAQLRFTRSEWVRGLKTVTAEEGTRRWARESSKETPGTKLHRTTYHYWFHLGESQAIRQMLGHTKLPDFVGGFGKSQYRPEA